MKKYHDELLRNIYELAVKLEDQPDNSQVLNRFIALIKVETMKSVALPAQYYVLGIKNLEMLHSITWNKQQTTYMDVEVIINNLIILLKARSPKQLRLSSEFINLIVKNMEVIQYAAYRGLWTTVKHSLKSFYEEVDNNYGWDFYVRKQAEYVKEHPGCDDWRHTTDEGIKAYNAYWDYCNSLRPSWPVQRVVNIIRKLVTIVDMIYNEGEDLS